MGGNTRLLLLQRMVQVNQAQIQQQLPYLMIK